MEEECATCITCQERSQTHYGQPTNSFHTYLKMESRGQCRKRYYYINMRQRAPTYA